MRTGARLLLFYAASLAAYAIESALIAIGLLAVIGWFLAGVDPTALAQSTARLAENFLAAAAPAKNEFLLFAALVGALTFLAVAALRAPAQLRRIRQDAIPRVERSGAVAPNATQPPSAHERLEERLS